MSLTVALNTAQLGLMQAERKVAVTSANINNADRAGYTRKEFASSYVSNGFASVPAGGVVVQSVKDEFLARQVNNQTVTQSYQETLSTYRSTYSQYYGSPGSGSLTLSSSMDGLTKALKFLEVEPANTSAKATIVANAQTVAATLNSLSSGVQNARLRANNEIGDSVRVINLSLSTIYDLNSRIAKSTATGDTIADLEDMRNRELVNLSKQMQVQYFLNSENRMIVYSTGGSSLVGVSQFQALDYPVMGSISGQALYPASIPPITIGGVDITTTIDTGRLGALLELRDTVFVDEQAKLDNLSNNMQTTVNEALNRGASYPPKSTITGTVDVSALPMVGTGILRVGVTDATGVVNNYSDIDISLFPSVAALIAQINTVPGVNAALDANGFLVVNATAAANRVSLNPTNTSVGGINVCHFFGLNNLFTTPSTLVAGAENIEVNSNLITDPTALATGTFSASATLAAGDLGITSGDGSTMTAVVNALDTPGAFAAAGNFGARTVTVANYIGAIIADAAVQASNVKSVAETAQATLSYLNNNLSNLQGVSIDEETSNITVLQTSYQANAQMISTVKALFEALLNAVR